MLEPHSIFEIVPVSEKSTVDLSHPYWLPPLEVNTKFGNTCGLFVTKSMFVTALKSGYSHRNEWSPVTESIWDVKWTPVVAYGFTLAQSIRFNPVGEKSTVGTRQLYVLSPFVVSINPSTSCGSFVTKSILYTSLKSAWAHLNVCTPVFGLTYDERCSPEKVYGSFVVQSIPVNNDILLDY